MNNSIQSISPVRKIPPTIAGVILIFVWPIIAVLQSNTHLSDENGYISTKVSSINRWTDEVHLTSASSINSAESSLILDCKSIDNYGFDTDFLEILPSKIKFTTLSSTCFKLIEDLADINNKLALGENVSSDSITKFNQDKANFITSYNDYLNSSQTANTFFILTRSSYAFSIVLEAVFGLLILSNVYIVKKS